VPAIGSFEISRKELALLSDIHTGLHVINREDLERIAKLGLVYWDKKANRAHLTPLGKSWLHDALRPRHSP